MNKKAMLLVIFTILFLGCKTKKESQNEVERGEAIFKAYIDSIVKTYEDSGYYWIRISDSCRIHNDIACMMNAQENLARCSDSVHHYSYFPAIDSSTIDSFKKAKKN